MGGRTEYKYLVPTSVLDAIRSDVMPFLEPDPFSEISAGGEYSVRSIYYDTPRLACYHEKNAGIEIRRKFRIRGYGAAENASLVFLEIKKRRGAVITKNRAPLLLSTLPQFLAAPDIDKYILGRSLASREDARRFLYYYHRMCLQPAVLVVYDREAFFSKFDPSLRVTFDKSLRGRLAPQLCDLHDGRGLSPVMKHHVIFELKFFHRSLPQWASDVIRRYGLPRMALSKYTMSMDLKESAPRIRQSPMTLPAGRADVAIEEVPSTRVQYVG